MAAPPAAEAATVLLAGAGYAGLRTSARAAAAGHRGRMDAIGASTTKDAKPAIKKAIKAVATPAIKGKRSLKTVRKSDLHKAARGADFSHLGQVMDRLITSPGAAPAPTTGTGGAPMNMAAPPPEIGTAAKLALALQVVQIIDSIWDALQDAPDGMTPSDFVDSLTDPNGLALDETLGGTFGATHPTNIATVATAVLREQLADPAFRKAHPYVMLVVTNPTARPGHRVMDGFILSAEEALYSPFLPPFDFGCDCVAVAITAEQARASGLTGAAPSGTLEEFLAAQGIRPSPYGGGQYTSPTGQTVTPGLAPGFSPSFRGTDIAVQLSALREKANELRGEDPEAWAKLHAWLLWLFGLDILTQDPPQEDANAKPA